jgi:hypothetical protein
VTAVGWPKCQIFLCSVQFDKLILTSQQPKYHQNRWTYARVFSAAILLAYNNKPSISSHVCVGMSFKMYTADSCVSCIFCAPEMLLALIPTASWCVLEYIRQFSLLYRSYSLCVYVFSMLVVFGKGLNQIRNPLQCRRATRENQGAPAGVRRRGIRTRRLTKQCRNSRQPKR